jgi:hypothetical protein
MNNSSLPQHLPTTPNPVFCSIPSPQHLHNMNQPLTDSLFARMMAAAQIPDAPGTVRELRSVLVQLFRNLMAGQSRAFSWLFASLYFLISKFGGTNIKLRS